MTLLIFLWFGFGLVGQIMLWVERSSWRFSPKNVWCPAPKDIASMIGGSFLGLIGFGVGIMMFLSSDDLFHDTWWTRPICGDKH